MIQAVCFDVFGTLIFSSSGLKPYTRLRSSSGEKPDYLTRAISIRQLAEAIGCAEKSDLLEQEVIREIAGFQLFSDVVPAIEYVRLRGLSIAVCSNLAFEYVAAVQRFTAFADHHVFSAVVGHRKPAPEIYQAVVRKLGIAPTRILFIGDSPRNDVEAPLMFGMKAAHLNRSGGNTLLSTVRKGLESQ